MGIDLDEASRLLLHLFDPFYVGSFLRKYPTEHKFVDVNTLFGEFIDYINAL